MFILIEPGLLLKTIKTSNNYIQKVKTNYIHTYNNLTPYIKQSNAIYKIVTNKTNLTITLQCS